jgi:hypothetical protein
VFNLSSIARAKISLPGFVLAWLRYKSRRPQRAFHWVSARPSRELRLWDALTAAHGPGGGPTRVPGIGCLDAHGIMKVAGHSYPLPTYEELFRTLRTHVVTPRPLSGGPDPDGDRALIHAALAAGHCYIAYDNYGDATGFVFEAAAADGDEALMGDELSLPAPSPRRRKQAGVRLSARAPRKRTLLRLYRNGRLVASARGGRLDFRATEPGAYRVEVHLYRHRLGRLCLGAKPWIFSNPLYLCPAPAPVV